LVKDSLETYKQLDKRTFAEGRERSRHRVD